MLRKPLPTAGAGLFALFALQGCISTESGVLQAAEGCDEYDEGKLDSVDLDPEAKAFIEASMNLETATGRITDDVFAACEGIALDLGADNTWKDEDSLKAQISNKAGTGACDMAVEKINAEVASAEDAGSHLKLAVAEGECSIDFDAQKECDSMCAANTTCEPGSVETRCEPGKIIANCQGSCEKKAYCVGHAGIAANCEGSCASTCVGECSGTCYHDDGSVSEDDPNCMGKCEGSCSGECYGRCEVRAEAGIECGKEVRCQGSCSGEITKPECVTEYDPPECKVDTACYESCITELAANASCEPTSVTVIADVKAEPKLEKVAKTFEKHLPPLMDAAKAEGPLLEAAANRMARTGGDLADKLEDVDGKSLACVGSAASGLSNSVDTISVSVEASLKIEGSVAVMTQN